MCICVFLNYLLFIFTSLYRLVSVMIIQGARCLNKKKENNLPALNVDMKLRKLRILACQVRLFLKYQWVDFAFMLRQNLSFFSFLSIFVFASSSYMKRWMCSLKEVGFYSLGKYMGKISQFNLRNKPLFTLIFGICLSLMT